MRKTILILTLLLLFTLSGEALAAPSHLAELPQPSTPSEVITAINQYRAQNGLPALQTNSLLTSLAQGQANYQASTSTVTHTGPGGTTPRERAIAAGYGGGANIFLSEIIYGGTNATSQTAFNWWKGSSVHNTVMLTSTYNEIGAGVSTDGTWNYYTAELGAVVGGSLPPSSSSPSSGSGDDDPEEDAQPAVPIAVPVFMATPNQDGAIIHIIQPGQALWTIAAVYDIDLQTLLALNGLSETALVFPGDEIIVRPANTATPAQGETSTAPPPTRTSHPTHTATSYGPAIQNTRPAQNPTNTPTPQIITEEQVNPTVRWIIILAFAILFIVLVGSFFFQKPPQRPQDDDPVR